MGRNSRLSEFVEDFIKKYDEDSNTEYFLKVDVEYLKTLFNEQKDLPFLPKRKKVEKTKNLFVVQKTKKNMLST